MPLSETGLVQSFAGALRAARPTAPIDERGHATFEVCLVEGVEPDRVRRAFPTADRSGPEGRQPRLYAADSPVMLAVNTLAPWLNELAGLSVLDSAGFRDLRFEVPLLPPGSDPPSTIAALLVSPAGLVGIESTGVRYLQPRANGISAELEAFWEDRAENGWHREMRAIKADPGRYRHLDAAWLVTQYAGLSLLAEAAGGEDRKAVPASLVYLYWEPLNAARFEEFSLHRDEARRFADAVGEADIPFHPLPFDELLAGWARGTAPKWLAMHLVRLHQRYSFRV